MTFSIQVKNFKINGLKILLFGIFMFLALNTAVSAANYQVKPGESLFLIGQKFGISAEQIQNANGLNSTEIYPGQKLYIPSDQAYTVKSGDTLYLIAKKYGISYQQLMQHNGLTYDYIEPGQILAIPNSNNTTNNNNQYIVKPGDTLFLIGRSFEVSFQEIQELNNLTTTEIQPGQVLQIPTKSHQITRSVNTVSRGGISRDDITLLARTVYSEARGEPYEGQVAVASVVLNRVKHPNFPNTIRGVIFEPLAFSAVADGQFWLTPNQTAYRAVDDALNGWDPSYGALYYWNPATSTSKWIWSRTITHRIGRHVFGY